MDRWDSCTCGHCAWEHREYDGQGLGCALAACPCHAYQQPEDAPAPQWTVRVDGQRRTVRELVSPRRECPRER